MILPTKHIRPDRCLIGLGGEVIGTLERPMTMSKLWDAIRRRRSIDDASAVVEFGGTGAIAGTESESLCTDVPCRGFWSYYAELMGIEAAGGIR